MELLNVDGKRASFSLAVKLQKKKTLLISMANYLTGTLLLQIANLPQRTLMLPN